MRSRLFHAAIAALCLNVAAPAHAQSATLDHARLVSLVKQVWAAGGWEDQRAAFERLPERERSAVWAALIDVRPGKVRYSVTESVLGTDADLRGPCQEQEIDQCDYAPAPKPSPTAAPRTNPSRPPVVTPPVTRCTNETAYVPYYVLGEDELVAFVYAGRTFWCYQDPSATGPLTDYSSYSFASQCCMLPWSTDASKYVDKLVAQPAANTVHIQDHHSGWFQADTTLGPVQGAVTNVPNIDASVLADGSYVCG
jgi:hypothetical protein